jgi:hypothetical protein
MSGVRRVADGAKLQQRPCHGGGDEWTRRTAPRLSGHATRDGSSAGLRPASCSAALRSMGYATIPASARWYASWDRAPDGATRTSSGVRAERPRRAPPRPPARRCAAHDRRRAPRRRRARDPRMGLLASGPSPLFVRRCVRRVRSSAGRATPPSRAPRAGAATVPTRLDARPEPLTSERHCSSQARVGSKISCAARRETRTSRWP